MAKFKMTVSLGLVGCSQDRVFEVADEDIEGMTAREVEQFVDQEYAREEVWNIVSYSVERVDDET